MSKIVKLTHPPTDEQECCKQSVEMLRELLKEAEAGDIQSLFYVAQRPNGQFFDDHTRSLDFPRAIGHFYIAVAGWINQFRGEHAHE